MNFCKAEGTGNDFIIINNIEEKIPENELGLLAKHLCNRRFSIGADGLMAVCSPTSEKHDFRMLFFNADGSMGEMCGNGARCICRYGFEKGLSGGRPVINVETTAGSVNGERLEEDRYRINMIDPSFIKDNYIELGNPGLPHLVIKYGGISSYIRDKYTYNLNMSTYKSQEKLYRMAHSIRWSPSYPKGTNVNFYDIETIVNSEGFEEECIYLRTFERGVEDFTLACGTGSVATAIYIDMLESRRSAVKESEKHLKSYKIHQQGGVLTVDIFTDKEKREIFLTGPANIIAEGKISTKNHTNN
ncbi:MAG: diaminopimelate epimerase [Firmicutes bacterium]|nr:diaminopimelate epimerase [Bacillota bacterium]